MDRRNFLKNTSIAGLAVGSNINLESLTNSSTSKFNLKFAPHLGMFEQHAGDDPMSQLDFMAEHGFSAFEDNGMRNRSIDLQQKIADRMVKHDMDMGVLVAHKIYWKEPNLTSGDSNL